MVSRENQEYYERIKNWQGDNYPFWAKLEDFIILEDGSMTIKGLKESDYSKILRNELYSSPSREYTYGTYFTCIKRPIRKFNIPYKCSSYWVNVDFPKGFMWYSRDLNTWDFADEFVISSYKSSSAHIKTIQALKHNIRKWKLPIGAIVRVTGRYQFDEYQFIIIK